MKANYSNNDMWSVILAGGEGERTRPFIQQWLGYSKPKQYCTFVGNRSMLQHTLDRADRMGKPHQKVTVIAENHLPYARETFAAQQGGEVVLQPYNCGTAAGIFLPLTYVRARNPNATVVIYPSDHFVFPEDRFLETVRRATRAIDVLQDRVLLLGVRPTHLELDYGWVNVGDILGRQGDSYLRQVESFMEKPSPLDALQAMSNGGLWNTLVMVAKVETLWSLGWQCLPVIMERFERLGNSLNTGYEQQTLHQLYQHMPFMNFSSDLLQKVPECLGVIELEEVLWSDWGRPERIRETLEVLGKKPAFPSEILTNTNSRLNSSMEVGK
jgi:mannose-1-phosphate guanylyltransferase